LVLQVADSQYFKSSFTTLDDFSKLAHPCSRLIRRRASPDAARLRPGNRRGAGDQVASGRSVRISVPTEPYFEGLLARPENVYIVATDEADRCHECERHRHVDDDDHGRHRIPAARLSIVRI
jgi:hypothetical protein